MKNILVGSPICQKPEILKEFLSSLEEVDQTNLQVAYLFVDDNKEEASKELLNQFAQRHQVSILPSDEVTQYICDDITHRWNQTNIDKVARFKNKMIEVGKDYDYLFLIDSDILLHPHTFQQLIKDGKDIISNIFWTKWQPDAEELPQVWLKDAYSFHDQKSNTMTTEEDIIRGQRAFIEMLRVPGVYKVGGLGACTLISQKALKCGVNFNDIYNVSFVGEDRSFCIRAAALGLELFVDTHYPAYHIYRVEELEGVATYKEENIKREKQVLGSKISQVLMNGIGTLMTYSYETPLSKEFMAYFTEEEGEKQFIQLEKRWAQAGELQMINKGYVTQCVVGLSDHMSRVTCTAHLHNKGYKQEYSYEEKLQCECEVILTEDKGYMISRFEIKGEIPFEKGIVRRVRQKPTLTLAMCVRNEAPRYLEQVLKVADTYIDYAVIIDDASTDETAEICKKILGDKLTLIQNTQSYGLNQTLLRYQLWQETIGTDPDWIIFLDADEILEKRGKKILTQLMRDRETDGYIMRIYDFWGKEHYREDKKWCRHQAFRPFMIRYQPEYQYTFNMIQRNECRMPNNVLGLNYKRSDLRIKHYGYAAKEDRTNKYREYIAIDPTGYYKSLDYYESILDENVQLIKWSDYHI